jgi:hypothetical protein
MNSFISSLRAFVLSHPRSSFYIAGFGDALIIGVIVLVVVI